MKKTLLLVSLIISSFLTSFAQTAPDFTANDCNGNSHNLYSELGQGKVIVLSWVMPCGACVGPALTAYNVVQSFANPDVLYYLIDDYGNSTCATISGWAANSGIGLNRTTFSSASIIQTNYGGVGMPHIVVVGPNGTIYFNGLNAAAGNSTAIQNAINDALTATGISDNNSNAFSVSVSPNPTAESLMLNYTLEQPASISFEVKNELGENVATYTLDNISAGKHEFQFDIHNYANGNYFVLFNAEQNVKVVKFAVFH